MSERILSETKRRALLVAAMLSSDKSGEVAGAVAALNRLLPGGLTVEDLVVGGIEALTETELAKGPVMAFDVRSTPAGGWLRCPWASKARECLGRASQFEASELQFLNAMSVWKVKPSDKQLAWLDRLHASLREAA